MSGSIATPSFTPTQFGEYMLLERVAAGGMAELFRGELTGIGGFRREVAVKKVLPQHADDAAFVEMLLDEARISARLVHPNIAQVLNCGMLDGTYFIVMEYVHGQSLRRLLRAVNKRDERLTLAETVHIVSNLALALDYAHKRTDTDGVPMEIVHRDVTPENILTSYDGEVKLVDFGIARAKSRLHQTALGQVRGKIAYMAPEQIQGKELDHRTDQFAVGLVLYELLSGRQAFTGETEQDVIRAAFNGEIALDRAAVTSLELPDEVWAVMTRALARAPKDRFADCGAFALALKRAIDADEVYQGRERLARRVRELFERDLKRARPASAADAPVPTLAGAIPNTPTRKLPVANASPSQSISSPQPEDTATPAIAETDNPEETLQIRKRRKMGAWVVAMGTVAATTLFWSVIRSPPPPTAPEAQAQKLTQEVIPPEAPATQGGVTLAPLEATGTDQVPEPAQQVQRQTSRRSKAIKPKKTVNVRGRTTPTVSALAAPPPLPPPPSGAVGRIDVACLPWCEVTIDGKPTGQTSPLRNYALTAGPHTVHVRNPPTGLEESRKITVKAGEPTTLQFRLR